ncbi:MAG: magnesium chelatase [Planctomycetaceae bacterium]|nr:magnesium chelatase [Planctomycetaceae bacterium]
MSDRPTTLGQLKSTRYQPSTVKAELRRNMIAALRDGTPMFQNVIGFDKTVIPQIINAVLAQHDIILLGLRGQAKTRVARQLTALLDEFIPILPDFPLNEDPLAPVSDGAFKFIEKHGDETPIAWIHRDQRYNEKLATPDVSMSDLIGDLDPIKAANLKLDLSNEQVIHFGIIARTNRGLFCINELPDLSPRIQVGLLNIMEERDIQIRGFPVRLPMDLLMIFTANPEDYTNRGSIITPLKDRIESQVHTHYPTNLEDALSITTQEAWVGRDSGVHVHVPAFLREVVEEVAFAARKSEYLDQSSGVSARLPIALLENVVSNAERRGLLSGEQTVCVRPVDFQPAVSAITGKVELVYQGEQEGALNVARHLVGRAIKAVFDRVMPEVKEEDPGEENVFGPYKPILDHFAEGKRVQLGDLVDARATTTILQSIPSLKQMADNHVPMEKPDLESVAAMELVLEGLHQSRMLGKDEVDGIHNYYDLLGDMIEDMEKDLK